MNIRISSSRARNIINEHADQMEAVASGPRHLLGVGHAPTKEEEWERRAIYAENVQILRWLAGVEAPLSDGALLVLRRTSSAAWCAVMDARDGSSPEEGSPEDQ